LVLIAGYLRSWIPLEPILIAGQVLKTWQLVEKQNGIR